ncbi:MAG: class I SAM-dependent rRNA methyltransferase [Bacteroidaceae bacterium]
MAHYHPHAPDTHEGEIVRVEDHEGRFLAVGHYQIGSIAVRILSFYDIEIDDNFWLQKLGNALNARKAAGIVRDDNNTYRLVHGEGDELPGLIVDIYDNAAIMQAHSVGMHLCRKEIALQLKALYGDRLESIYYKSETTLPYKANLNEEKGFLLGRAADVTATENALKFHIDWLKGQKTGFFVDQRDNRKLVEQYAKGRKVLNMFCYTGGFSVYAIRGGATLVHSVDSSERAIEMTDKNVELNFALSADRDKHQSFATDAFKYFAETDNSYDMIILDPPAFAKHKDALRNAIKGYTRLNAKAIQKIKPGGILFTFSCSQAVSKEQFRLAVFTAAAQSHRFVRILHQLHQPADHPINIFHPEGEYLKGLVLYVE